MKRSVPTKPEVLGLAIRQSWGRETSQDSTWSDENPASGQCAITALIVQDFYGGDLVRAKVGEISHYWNLVDGKSIDLTREQFTSFEPGLMERRDRSYVLSFPATERRYSILKKRVQKILVTDTGRCDDGN
jgi:hypothetical protein